MALLHATTQKWTVDEFHRLLELGFWGPDERVELIEGEIVKKPKQKPPHSGAVLRSNKRFVLAFHETHEIACQLPIELSEYSEPYPDFAIIPTEKAPRGMSFVDADLIMEVSDSSLRFDRIDKMGVYAKAEIQEYWVLNVRAEQLEVYRDPHPDPKAKFGHSYATRLVLSKDDLVSPLCRPDVHFRAADLL